MVATASVSFDFGLSEDHTDTHTQRLATLFPLKKS